MAPTGVDPVTSRFSVVRNLSKKDCIASKSAASLSSTVASVSCKPLPMDTPPGTPPHHQKDSNAAHRQKIVRGQRRPRQRQRNHPHHAMGRTMTKQKPQYMSQAELDEEMWAMQAAGTIDSPRFQALQDEQDHRE